MLDMSRITVHPYWSFQILFVEPSKATSFSVPLQTSKCRTQHISRLPPLFVNLTRLQITYFGLNIYWCSLIPVFGVNSVFSHCKQLALYWIVTYPEHCSEEQSDKSADLLTDWYSSPFNESLFCVKLNLGKKCPIWNARDSHCIIVFLLIVFYLEDFAYLHWNSYCAPVPGIGVYWCSQLLHFAVSSRLGRFAVWKICPSRSDSFTLYIQQLSFCS